eukprot:gene12988-8836_t
MDRTPIHWPPKLLQTTIDHLQRVEDPESPSMPPLLKRMDVLTFFQLHAPLLRTELSRRGESADPQWIQCCTSFVIDLLEQACAQNFLVPRERRCICAAASNRERQMLTAAGAPKRRRHEGHNASGTAKFAPVLPLEYLLRLIVAMPQVLEHYDRLGGAALPSYCKGALWSFMNSTLALLDSHPEFFSPLQMYAPLR